MGVSNSAALTDSFRINPYGAYKMTLHSRSNKRGVGILIKHSIDFSVLGEVKDTNDNFLIQKLSFDGKIVILCAIYGPNNVQPEFFQSLKRSLLSMGDYPIIMGGDWNCTTSCENSPLNDDILNMRSPPNLRHSTLLKNLCHELNLADPYRVKFPNRKEFTFVPKDTTKSNRSRIDFFVVSKSVIDKINKCSIMPNMQNKMFDHRAVVICFKDPPKVIKQPTISRELLKDPDLELHVLLTVADTYLLHTSSIANDEINRRLREIGSAKRLIRDIGPDKCHLPVNSRTELEENIRSGRLGEIRELLEDFPLDRLETGTYKDGITDDIFMETLVNNIRNECISYQIFLAKTSTETVSNMSKELSKLKANYVENQNQIITLEKRLDEIADFKLRSKLEATANFEILNAENITPHFLSLARGEKSEARLSDILDDDGQNFQNDAALKEYVRGYYQNLYRKPACDDNFNPNCIQEFLGPDILNSGLVRDSIISEATATQLESPLSLEELDRSAAQGNKSASGMDGLSNCFIKKFWNVLRKPLHRYTIHAVRTGTLSSSFKTASIKLIPKKGDCTKLKNWRPISLLSCLYKVISRALNNRLKKVSSTIFSRSQKGFTKDRFIQEVLINVIEMVAHCKEFNIPGAILSIDQSKAFDSVSHLYMHSVYEFFGFGPQFIRLLETLGNNRTACIAFEDGSHSAEIALECGRAQGNTSSPVEYNMAEQIVLFKIELCPDVRSVYVNHFIARPYLPNPVPQPEIELLAADLANPEFRNECGFQTSKSDSFADDNSTGTLLEYDSLKALKTILMDFAEISGLKCNTEKTVLMPIGPRVPISEDITNLGFCLKESIHILGMDIDRDLEQIDENFEKTIVSLKKCVQYWKRYNLTLTGRINIIKSLLFSQILYLGNFIMPSAERLKKIQTVLDEFAVGSMNFAKNRIYLAKEEGGLGLFNVENFLVGQQAVWVLRANQSTRDNWRFKLRSLCNGNVLCAGPHLIKKARIRYFMGW
jgi:exonuclease III